MNTIIDESASSLDCLFSCLTTELLWRFIRRLNLSHRNNHNELGWRMKGDVSGSIARIAFFNSFLSHSNSFFSDSVKDNSRSRWRAANAAVGCSIGLRVPHHTRRDISPRMQVNIFCTKKNYAYDIRSDFSHLLRNENPTFRHEQPKSEDILPPRLWRQELMLHWLESLLRTALNQNRRISIRSPGSWEVTASVLRLIRSVFRSKRSRTDSRIRPSHRENPAFIHLSLAGENAEWENFTGFYTIFRDFSNRMRHSVETHTQAQRFIWKTPP